MISLPKFARMPIARWLSVTMLAVSLSGCALQPVLETPPVRPTPSSLSEKKMPAFETWSSEVSSYFSEVEKAIGTPQETTTP